MCVICVKAINKMFKTLPLFNEEEEPKHSVTITLTRKILFKEFERLGVYGLINEKVMQIGIHDVRINDTNPNDKRVHRDFLSCMYLFTRKDTEPALVTSVCLKGFHKFIALKYGMQLFSLYRNPEKVEQSMKLKQVKAKTFNNEGKEEKSESSFIAKLLQESSQYDVEISTDDYGVIKVPTENDFKELYDKMIVTQSLNAFNAITKSR